ncbi:MAG: aquaporin [Chloroflexi bacterium]|nr:aquaporin [Chloroflexota bacterium]
MTGPVDYRKLIAEVIGTFTLIFAGAGAIVVTGGTNLVGIAFAHGLAIALMVSTFGHVSGGLFNPALSIGLWVTRRMDSVNAVAYIAAQLVGGLAGAAALVVLFPDVEREATALGTPALNAGVTFAQGVGIEAVLTFFLMLAVFGTALDARGPKLGGLVIGLIITMDIFAGGPLTGAAMNPARALGPAVLAGSWDDHLVYWIGPIIGAVLAALVYHYVFMNGEERAPAG